ncbi:hypothetical protein [Rhodococcus sp. SJ-2]
MLETYGIDNYFKSDPRTKDASSAIYRLVCGGHCSRMDPISGPPGFGRGVMLAGLGMEHQHSVDPDLMVETLNQWMTIRGRNLRESLAGEQGERHGFLVIDALRMPATRWAAERGLDFRPTIPPDLPEEIDVLWVLVNELLLRFDRQTGWQAQLISAVDYETFVAE